MKHLLRALLCFSILTSFTAFSMERGPDKQISLGGDFDSLNEDIFILIFRTLQLDDKVSWAMTAKGPRAFIMGILKASDFSFSIDASNAEEHAALFKRLEKLKEKDRLSTGWGLIKEKGLFESLKTFAEGDLFEFQPYCLSSVVITVNNPEEFEKIKEQFSPDIIRKKYNAPIFLCNCMTLSHPKTASHRDALEFHDFFEALLGNQSELKSLIVENGNMKASTLSSFKALAALPKLSSCALKGFAINIYLANILGTSTSLNNLTLSDIAFTGNEDCSLPKNLEVLVIEGGGIPKEVLVAAAQLKMLTSLKINCDHRTDMDPEISECCAAFLKKPLSSFHVQGRFATSGDDLIFSCAQSDAPLVNLICSGFGYTSHIQVSSRKEDLNERVKNNHSPFEIQIPLEKTSLINAIVSGRLQLDPSPLEITLRRDHIVIAKKMNGPNTAPLFIFVPATEAPIGLFQQMNENISDDIKRDIFMAPVDTVDSELIKSAFRSSTNQLQISGKLVFGDDCFNGLNANDRDFQLMISFTEHNNLHIRPYSHYHNGRCAYLSSRLKDRPIDIALLRQVASIFNMNYISVNDEHTLSQADIDEMDKLGFDCKKCENQLSFERRS